MGEILNIYYTGSGAPTPYTNDTEWAKMGRGGEMGQGGRPAGPGAAGARRRRPEAAAKPAAGGLPCGPQPGTLQKAGALSLWGGTGIFLSQGE